MLTGAEAAGGAIPIAQLTGSDGWSVVPTNVAVHTRRFEGLAAGYGRGPRLRDRI
ncbi:MAG: hypothetical protein WAU75_06260 [Solirubrobacteraceae bacterium]